MKYDVLFNFISPVTGRLCIPEDYILIGDGQGFSMPSPILIDIRLDLINLRRDVNDIFDTSFIIGFPDIDFPQAQVLSKLDDGFMYNTKGIVSTKATIPVINLPDLTDKHFWVGDSNNRPQETGLSYKNLIIGTQDNKLGFREKIYIDNLSDLTFKAIWRGNINGRPIESDDLTTLETKVTKIEDVSIPELEAEIAALEVEIAALEAEIVAIQAEIAVIQGQVTVLEGTVVVLQGQILVIQGQIAAIQGQIATINQRIDNLRLNNIPADGDVSFSSFKLINLADPVNQTDGINLRTLISYINNVPTTIDLIGDVTGSGNTGTPISTTLQLTLDQIKIAQNTVNLNNQKIINLKSDDVEQKDALNAKFLWDLMHDQVEVIWV